MRDIKKIAKKYRDRNGNEKITNKELLWFVISKFDDLEERVSKTETRQNMMLWFIPVVITLTAIIVSLV